jgi:2,3-bisphosphoglycerate-dependent phosphoglycerate mutase
MARATKDIKPAVCYTSALSRAKDTLEIILHDNDWTRVPVHADAALNERDYGDLTGMNKWVVEEQFGRAQFDKWRRGWDEPVPYGETLKIVFRRVVPYFEKHILPDLEHGKNVLITAHGNTLRALIKYLEELTDLQIQSVEMPFGELLVYTLDAHGKVTAKIIRKLDIPPPPA